MMKMVTGEYRRQWKSGINGLMEIIVALCFIQMVLASTIPSIKVFQAPVELLLAALLVYKIGKMRLLIEHIFLIGTYFIVTVCSLYYLDLDTFLVSTKQNGLGVLSLIAFSGIKYSSRLIFPIVILTSSLVLVFKVSPELMRPLIQITFNVEHNLSRFGGIFLNAHYNAFFLSIALIYYGQQRPLFGGGLLLLSNMSSRFIFVSYIANLFFSWLFPAYGIAKKKLFIMLVLLGLVTVLCLGLYFSDELRVILIAWNEARGNTQNSLVVILLQLMDPAYYTVLLNPFPSGAIDVSESAKIIYLNFAENEIGFFALATQSGVIFGFLYLALLIKNAPLYLVFIVFSLLHNHYIMSPLAVYMMLNFSSINAAKKLP